MSKVLIIGKGIVGTNFGAEIKELAPDFTDPPKGLFPSSTNYDFGFVCVDTPLVDGLLDTSIVESAIHENDCGVYIIKSTVPVGFTSELSKTTGKKIVFSPEYYGATQHANARKFDFTILGGEKEYTEAVQQLLQEAYNAYHSFVHVSSNTAEMAKLMENSWIATKVTFCCEFAQAAEEFDVSYEELRECFIKDPRIEQSHTFVYRKHPYYDSHCLNKDVPHAAKQLELPILNYVISSNDRRKKMI